MGEGLGGCGRPDEVKRFCFNSTQRREGAKNFNREIREPRERAASPADRRSKQRQFFGKTLQVQILAV
jgi:hypothetical protein